MLLLIYDYVLYWYINPCLRLLDHRLKWVTKSFFKFLSHVHMRKAASSIILLLSKESLENIMSFLYFQIVQVTASHQHFHRLILNPSATINPCWRKCRICLDVWETTILIDYSFLWQILAGVTGLAVLAFSLWRRAQNNSRHLLSRGAN